MKFQIFFSMAVLYFFLLEGRAQTHVRAGARASTGSIIAHSSDLRPISQSAPFGVSASVQWMKTSRENWEACDCFHYLGLEAFHFNFNNPSILGTASGISGTFEPLLWSRRSWRLSLRTGMGISYLSKVYDPIDNPANIFFSNPVSFLLFVSPTVEYQFSSDWSGSFSLSYNHISNGGQKQPNKGMNFPALELSFFRYLSNEELPRYERSPAIRPWQFLAEAAVTTRNTGSAGRKPVLMLAAEAYHPLGAINALGAGFDVVKEDSGESGKSLWGSMTLAPFIAHHFTLGKIDFSQWMALYLHKPEEYNDHLFYQRYILRYKLLENLSAGIGLKVHGHVAENIDFRLAWHW